MKGYKYASLLVDINGERIIEVVKDRTLDSANEVWSKIPIKVRDNIEVVAMDMWPAFMTSTKLKVPKADIVHDKFHIAKYLNEAVDKVRKSEHKELMEDGDETLKGKKYLFLKNPDNMNDTEVSHFKNLKLNMLQTGRAWSIKEMFANLWVYAYKDRRGSFLVIGTGGQLIQI